MVEKSYIFVPAPRLVCVELNPGPPRSKHLTDEEKWAVISLWKIDKVGTRAIAKKLKIRRKNVKQLIHKYQETGSVSTKSGQGRKRKLSSADVTRILKKAKTGKSARAIAQEEAKTHGGTMGRETIRRALKGSGLQYMNKLVREQLSNEHMRKRREYATKRILDDWKNVLFSDEKTFWLGAQEKKAWQDPKHRTLTFKRRYTPKLQVWGGIGHYFKTRLYFFEQNMDAKLYVKILKARLPPSCSDDCPDNLLGAWIFQQDNDPKHKAGIATQLLDEIAPDRIKDHPPSSPDFNIIEDVWAHMDRERKKKNISSIDHLKEELTQIWENLPWEFVRKSVASMPRRLQQCLHRHGQRTEY